MPVVRSMMVALMLIAGAAVTTVQANAPPTPDQDLIGRAVSALEALNQRGLLDENAEPGSAEAAEAAAILRAHGFTPVQWMTILHIVTDGYIAVKTARWRATPGAAEDYAALREALRTSPDLSETARAEALAELHRRFGPQVAETPSARAVAPYEERLDGVFDVID